MIQGVDYLGECERTSLRRADMAIASAQRTLDEMDAQGLRLPASRAVIPAPVELPPAWSNAEAPRPTLLLASSEQGPRITLVTPTLNQADLLAYLNSDDVLLPGALDAVLAYFDGHPDVAWAYGGWQLVGTSGRVYRTVTPAPYSHARLLDYCHIGQPSCFFRRALLDRVGLLNAALHYAMDYDLRLRQYYYHARGVAVVMVGWNISDRIARFDRA